MQLGAEYFRIPEKGGSDVRLDVDVETLDHRSVPAPL